jgi:hypothetical protein
MQKMVILLKPEDIETSAKEFLSTYASYMESVGIYGKGSDGHANYQSKTAPVHEGNVEFFEEWVEIANALEINTAVGMDLYTDRLFAKDPKYQSMNDKGKAMDHQICPNSPEFWQYASEIVTEIGHYPVDEIFVFGAGFIRDRFCFCEKCRNDFAPLVNQEPDRLTHQYLTENPEYHEKWHEWRSGIVHQGIEQLQAAARDISESTDRIRPLKLSIEMLLDPITGLTENVRNEYGYDWKRILDITGSMLVNLYPWSPILPAEGSAEYDDLVDSLYFSNEFKRRGGDVTLFRWGVDSIEEVKDLKGLQKEDVNLLNQDLDSLIQKAVEEERKREQEGKATDKLFNIMDTTN